MNKKLADPKYSPKRSKNVFPQKWLRENRTVIERDEISRENA